MADRDITVEVRDYAVDDPTMNEDEIKEVARDLASDIGMRLSDLGRGSKHGSVTIKYPQYGIAVDSND